MPQTVVVVGAVVTVQSFTDGVRVAKPTPRSNEDAVLAQAMWLQNHIGPERADEYLEKHLRYES